MLVFAFALRRQEHQREYQHSKDLIIKPHFLGKWDKQVKVNDCLNGDHYNRDSNLIIVQNEDKEMDKLKETSTQTPTYGLASTSRMRTAISPGRWQPWTSMPCWWAQIRAKQPSMAATARVIWLCACVRYWLGLAASCSATFLQHLRFSATFAIFATF